MNVIDGTSDCIRFERQQNLSKENLRFREQKKEM